MLKSTMFTLWLMLVRVCSSTIPYSASEAVTTAGDDCIQLFSEPDRVLDCFLEISDEITTYTLKSRFLDAYGQQFGDTLPAEITRHLSTYYRQLAIRHPAQEANKLQEEVDRLGKNKEYVRLLNLLMKFKNPELPTLRAFIDQIVRKLERYANQQLSCRASYAHEFMEAYTILTQIYSYNDRVEEKLTITEKAIHLFIEHDAEKRYPLEFQYFQKQHQQAMESIENNQSNLKST